MPGSGKTTVGGLLSGHLGRELVDTDHVIIAQTGIPVAEIFRLRGEPCFREMEALALREAARTPDGKVIATGGGAVLRRDNIAALRRTGLLVFLDRPLAELTPSAERPVADSVEKLEALYRQRYPLYVAAADCRVGVYGTPEDTLAEVLACIAGAGRRVS